MEKREPLLNSSYICCCLSNFFLYFSFYLVVPILAFYLMDTFGVDGAWLGASLSAYIVSAMVIRPFSAFLIDSLPRKPFLIVSLVLFAAVFLSYQVTLTIVFFIFCRILHGLTFGMVSIGSNTIVIDVIPSSRRGEGLGYYGWSNNFAMATSPILGIYLHDNLAADIRYQVIFLVAFGFSMLALLMALPIRSKYKAPVSRPPLSLDRFFLKNGIPAGFNLMLMSIPYGATMNYIALYTQELGFTLSTGIFYMCMAIGIAVSRIFAGKQVDRGYLNAVIQTGTAIAALAFFALALLPHADWLGIGLRQIIFFVSALTIGVGYGIIFPAYNTLFVALGTNQQRGSATSTYLTSWEIGSGIGIYGTGILISVLPVSVVYVIGFVFDLSAIAFYHFYTAGHFMRHRIGYMPASH